MIQIGRGRKYQKWSDGWKSLNHEFFTKLTAIKNLLYFEKHHFYHVLHWNPTEENYGNTNFFFQILVILCAYKNMPCHWYGISCTILLLNYEAKKILTKTFSKYIGQGNISSGMEAKFLKTHHFANQERVS